jgi:hypothetical protein
MSAKEGKQSKPTEASNAGFKWNNEIMQNATKNLTFIKVGGTKVAPRVLSGTVRSWKSGKPNDKDLIFSIPYRITGTEENVRKALTLADVSKSDIEEALKSAISYQNYKTPSKAALIVEENLKRTKKRDTNNEEEALWENIIFFASNKKNKQFKLVPRKSELGAKNKRETAAPTKGNRRPLHLAVEQVAKGKVIDVSGLDTKTGGGYITIPVPKENSKSGKYGVESIAMVSNNLNTWNSALDFIYGEDAHKTTHKELSDEFQKKLSKVGSELLESANGKKKQQQPKTVKVPAPKAKKEAAPKPAAKKAKEPKTGKETTSKEPAGEKQKRKVAKKPKTTVKTIEKK